MLSTLLVFFVLGSFWAVAVSQVYNAKVLFYHNSLSSSYALTQAEKVIENPNFDRSRRTVFYFHGAIEISIWLGTPTTIVNAYTTNGDFNILILDWRELATAFYPIAVSKIGGLATEVAKFLQKMTTNGYAVDNWHLVGYSLGAHLAGNVARFIKYWSNGLHIIPRITGLDPSYPGYDILLKSSQPINKTDASFVDVIHTDPRVYGIPFNVGTVDFWLNDRHKSMPGCSFLSDIIGCSHHRSVEVYAESVENKRKKTFTSQNEVDFKIQVQMGLNCPTDAQPGSYILATNFQRPYSRG